MKIKNIYMSDNDLRNMGNSERVALQFVFPFYDNKTRDTERIKEQSLPKHTLFNCVYAITQKLKIGKIPELSIDEIWTDITRSDAAKQPQTLLGVKMEVTCCYGNMADKNFYEYRTNFDCEAGVIFGCVYVILSLDNPGMRTTLQRIKAKVASNGDAEKYFRIMERNFIKNRNKMKNHQEKSPKEKNNRMEETRIDSEKDKALIDLYDVMEIIDHHYFPYQEEAKLLEILNTALYAKQYPEDICGKVEKKIQFLKQAAQTESVSDGSNLRLSTKKGTRVNFIRLIYVLDEFSIFTNRNGNDITKKEVFESFGKFLNLDLSTFHNDLSATKSVAKSDMKNTYSFFEKILDKAKEINLK